MKCSLSFSALSLTEREPHSQKINDTFGEGGALNANYRTVEAVARATEILCLQGMRYGEHYEFETGGLDSIVFSFRDETTMNIAKEILGGCSLEPLGA